MFILLSNFMMASNDICSDEIADISGRKKLFTCMNIDLSDEDSKVFNSETSFPDLINCKDKAACKKSLSYYVSSYEDTISRQIASSLLPSNNPKEDLLSYIPNSCNCMASYKNAIDPCTKTLLKEYYAFCERFYPISPNSTGDPMYDCSLKVISACNSSSINTYATMVDCIEVNVCNTNNS